MSVYSMTGYANAPVRASVNDGTQAANTSPAVVSASLELRSVNSRFLDLGFRMPDDLRALEAPLRELLSSSFRRGKIECRLNPGRDEDGGWPQPTPEKLHALGRLEGTVQAWLPQAGALSTHEILQWCRQGGQSVRNDEAWLAAAREAVQGLREAREREGDRLREILLARVARLRELATQAEPLVPQVVQRQQQRFLERWQEAVSAVGAGKTVTEQALHERALGEAAAYALRIDVAEELSRLGAHLDEIERLLQRGGELGKRLDFLIQELHREANTLGSKSSALELTQISVEMKVAIEQLKEQVQNVE